MIAYKNINEVVNNYKECTQNNHWENFNFPDACKWLKRMIDFSLIDYAQCSEETFVSINLQMRFPNLTKEEMDHCEENENGIFVVDENAKNFSNKDLLPAFKKLETMRFSKLEKEYKDNPYIVNLNSISSCLQELALGKGDGWAQVEKIALINAALNAKHPRGIVFKFVY